MKNLFENMRQKIQNPRFTRALWILCAVLVVVWVIYRGVMISIEKTRFVFNPARAAADSGVPVRVMNAVHTSGEIHEPIAVKNNRAYVSGARASMLRPGQPVGDGVIVSVSSNIDLDTGMYVVHTRGASDGLQDAVFRANGYFVPLYAVSNDVVYVLENGIASQRNVNVARQDSETAYITSGLNDGDQVILTKVVNGQKVKVQE